MSLHRRTCRSATIRAIGSGGEEGDALGGERCARRRLAFVGAAPSLAGASDG
jgi:hypothetical protein